MPLGNPIPGVGSAIEYAVSSLPWVTSSIMPAATLQISFPFVTQFVTVKNTSSSSAGLNVGFTANGTAGSNYIPLDPSGSFSGDFRLTSLFLKGTIGSSFTVIAGLTGIPASNYGGILTGSAGFAGVG